MKSLVTGGAGFLGVHLAKRLVVGGHDVTVLAHSMRPEVGELEKLGVNVVFGDVTDRKLVDGLAGGCDVVYHLAAAFRKVNLSDKVYWDVNVEGTRNMLEASLKHGVKRFIHCSTCGVHGNVRNPPANEDTPIAPEDHYQHTKAVGEETARGYNQKGLPVVVIRPGAIYGPGDRGRFLMLFRKISSGKFIIAGDGKTTYHPVYIDNLVDGFMLAAEKKNAAGQTYIIADEKYYTLNDLVGEIASVMGVGVRIVHVPFWPVYFVGFVCEVLYKPFSAEPPIFRRRVEFFRMNRAFDISKAKKELGYEPKVGLREGVGRTVAWCRESGLL